MTKIFITGANGFVGNHLINEFTKRGLSFVPGSRALYGELSTQAQWEKLLVNCSAVVHLAARVHVMNEKSADPLREFREVNVIGTMNLARASKKIGVKRFIFLSSVKVNGEENFEKAYSADDVPAPLDYYGISKMEAEIELMTLHEPGVFEVVVIRPPLVYGEGVKANFEKLMLLVYRDLPLPFGLVHNVRSMVSVLNLCDLICVTLNHPKASGEVFLVRDAQNYSLREIIIQIAKTRKKTAHLLPVPVGLMKFFLILIGKKSFSDRLFGNLHLDISKNNELLSWTPPYSFQDTFKGASRL